MGKCIIKDCDRKRSYKNGLCPRHYQQIRQSGKIFKRTRYDPNEFIIKDNICEIVLYNKNHNKVAKTIVDDFMFDIIQPYKWYLDYSTGYVVTHGENKNIYLHSLIIGKPLKENMITDHINRNKLDNRKCNLRFVTHLQSILNRTISKNNTSGIRGVTWCKESKKWIAQIMINYKGISLGHYKNKEDAITARKNAEIKYWGDWANYNSDNLNK